MGNSPSIGSIIESLDDEVLSSIIQEGYKKDPERIQRILNNIDGINVNFDPNILNTKNPSKAQSNIQRISRSPAPEPPPPTFQNKHDSSVSTKSSFGISNSKRKSSSDSSTSSYQTNWIQPESNDKRRLSQSGGRSPAPEPPMPDFSNSKNSSTNRAPAPEPPAPDFSSSRDHNRSRVPESPSPTIHNPNLSNVNPSINQQIQQLSINSKPSESTDINGMILQELNLVRTNPMDYVQFVEQYLSYYDGDILDVPGKTTRIRTNEGISAVHECIDFLKSTNPVPPLCMDLGMSKAAKDHVKDLGETGTASHEGSDGSSMCSRIEKYGDWKGTIGENISLGWNTARDVVMQLLIDDGISSRGHRKNIMNSQFYVVGIAHGSHKYQDYVSVIDFAGGFGPRVERLKESITVTAQGEITPIIDRILESIPFDSMKEDVRKALEPNGQDKVQLVYTPSSIEITFYHPDGSSVTQSGNWSVQDIGT